jgi:hypothetical protein
MILRRHGKRKHGAQAAWFTHPDGNLIGNFDGHGI